MSLFGIFLSSSVIPLTRPKVLLLNQKLNNDGKIEEKYTWHLAMRWIFCILLLPWDDNPETWLMFCVVRWFYSFPFMRFATKQICTIIQITSWDFLRVRLYTLIAYVGPRCREDETREGKRMEKYKIYFMTFKIFSLKIWLIFHFLSFLENRAPLSACA